MQTQKRIAAGVVAFGFALGLVTAEAPGRLVHSEAAEEDGTSAWVRARRGLPPAPQLLTRETPRQQTDEGEGQAAAAAAPVQRDGSDEAAVVPMSRVAPRGTDSRGTSTSATTTFGTVAGSRTQGSGAGGSGLPSPDAGGDLTRSGGGT